MAQEKAEGSPYLQYQTTINGQLDSSVRQVLTEISGTLGLEERPPLTMQQLIRRAQADVGAFTRALRSIGYYAAEISYRVDDRQTPIQVNFEVNPGPPFVISRVEFENLSEDSTKNVTLPEPEKIGLVRGQRIQSPGVLAARNEINKILRSQGFPFPRTDIREVIIDHVDHTASIFFSFDPGPAAVFGDTQVSGLSRIKPEYILERIPWKKGDSFEAPKMDDFRRKLATSGLFTLVEVKHAESLAENRHLPIFVQVTERKPRTIRAGASYQTDIGPELEVGWTHRNFKGMGEKLDFRLSLSEVLQSLEGEYVIPGFRRKDQGLIFKAGFVNEEQDAYDSTSLYAVSMLERQLTRELSAGAGLGYRLARVKQRDEESDLGLLFLPARATWDNRDDILDPSRGIRLNLELTPFVDTLNTDTKFLKAYASLSNYLELWPNKKIILANRVAIGTIPAGSRSKVPPDERFYAGGAGSVRGYSFQWAGPLEDNEPIGGLSLAEINTELRVRTARRQGLVFFLDGGRAYDSSYPNSDEKLFWGCGIGYRFYTDFGPIRMDLAFPLNRRKDVDDRFQIYISLGQAF
ncbi:MAG: outer membrane protein assembly factor [Deltaproteobacteria bacterium]|nr:outer membrane protein assembly factor [Deltaproteobacteria bacterium]